MTSNHDVEQFAVVLDSATLARSPSGQITAVIYVHVDDRAFPDASWSDLVVSVLEGWIAATLELFEGMTTQARLHFLDGPFRVDLSGNAAHRWTASLVQDRKQGALKTELDVDPRSVVSTLLEACRHLLHECERRRWSSRDLVHLAALTRRLERANAGNNH